MKKEIAEPPIVVQCKQHGTPANVMGKDDDDDDDDDDDGRNKNQAQQAQRRKTTHAVARCESSGSISSLCSSRHPGSTYLRVLSDADLNFITKSHTKHIMCRSR